LTNAIYGFFVLPESLPLDRRAKSAWHMANPLGSLTLLRSNRELSGLASVFTIFYLAQNALPSVFVLYAEYRYQWNERQVGFSLALIGVCAALVSGGLVGPYIKRFGERIGVLSGLCYGVLGFLGFALAWRGWFLLASIPLIALWGVAGPSIQSLMTRRVDPSSQGKLQGALNSLRAITTMFGPLIFTQVFAYAISPAAPRHIPGAPYFLGAVLLTITLLAAAYVTRGFSSAPVLVPAAAPEPATPDTGQ
jgi:DHA1 family tetracycline resistance protein-like MFS transporter